MKTIIFHSPAIKALARIPVKESRKIRQKISLYATDPNALKGNVKKLQGRDGYRLRVGNWRVIFDENGEVLDILDIGSRGSIY